MTKTRQYHSSYPASSWLLVKPSAYDPAWIEHGGTFAGATYAIQDESIDGESGIDGRSRPCLHTKNLRALVNQDLLLGAPDGGESYVALPSASVRKILSNEPFPPSPPGFLTESQWGALDAKALEVMLPSMTDGNSVINFLIEMRDFRKLAEAFRLKKNRLKVLVLGDEGVSDETLRQALKKRTLKSLSQSYLNYSFAWAPLVSDIMNMYSTLNTFNDRLDNIRKRANSKQSQHYRQVLDDSDTDSGALTDVSEVVDSFPLRGKSFNRVRVGYKERKLHRLVYRASCRYTYSMPDQSDLQIKIRAWLDSFGVRLDPSIIWNAIPFSFIVDWVYDVGGFLRRFSVNNLDLQIVVHDFCSSQKWITARDYHAYHIYEGASKGPSEYCGTVLNSFYHRRVVTPDVLAAARASGLDVREVSLLAALTRARYR